MLKVGGFFAGIGGLELGLSRAGHPTEFLSEIDPACRAVLQTQLDRDVFGDLKSLKRLPAVDLISAGFPCQDLSQAGKCRGFRGSQSSLVNVLLDLIEARKSRPPWILLENVKFLLHLDRGRPMRAVLKRLSDLGYDWAYRVVDTRAFGLPHRRERIFILASNTGNPADVLLADDANPDPIDSSSMGFYWTEGNRGLGRADDAIPTLKGGSTVGIPSPPAIWLRDGRIVTPDIRDAERLQGFEADWTEPAEGIDRASSRWKLVGNAVSVPVAEWIGRRLKDPGSGEEPEYPLRWRKPLPKAAWFSSGRAWRSDASSWPIAKPFTPIHDFLEYEPKPLSHRASSGFLSRFERSTLKKPNGFIAALRKHINDMEVEPVL